MSDLLSAGRLEDHPFAELSGLIFQESRTGELILESGDRRRTVWFLGGNPVAVVSERSAGSPRPVPARARQDRRRRRAPPRRPARDARGARQRGFPAQGHAQLGREVPFRQPLLRPVPLGGGRLRLPRRRAAAGTFPAQGPGSLADLQGRRLLGQAAVFDAVPDDAVCGAGPVSAADARYLEPRAPAAARAVPAGQHGCRDARRAVRPTPTRPVGCCTPSRASDWSRSRAAGPAAAGRRVPARRSPGFVLDERRRPRRPRLFRSPRIPAARSPGGIQP